MGAPIQLSNVLCRFQNGLVVMMFYSSLFRSLLHTTETIVIDWSNQVRDVLKQDSSQPLKEGKHPCPDVEIQFWDARHENLKSMYSQVCPLHYFNSSLAGNK